MARAVNHQAAENTRALAARLSPGGYVFVATWTLTLLAPLHIVAKTGEASNLFNRPMPKALRSAKEGV